MTSTEYDTSALAHEEEGYDKGLKPRQLQMIAIGGAIGTGLFMGAGGRLNTAGPGLFIVYGVCGVFVFFILRALGELVLTIALIALVITLTVNMISVKVFGEMEFWAALIKVVALVTFLVVGIVFLAGRFTVEGQPTGVSVIATTAASYPPGYCSW
jgi:L-asparagine permease